MKNNESRPYLKGRHGGSGRAWAQGASVTRYGQSFRYSVTRYSIGLLVSGPYRKDRGTYTEVLRSNFLDSTIVRCVDRMTSVVEANHQEVSVLVARCIYLRVITMV
jgi:hypothetical protein